MNSGFATPLPHHADALHRHWPRRSGHISFIIYFTCIKQVEDFFTLLSLFVISFCFALFYLCNQSTQTELCCRLGAPACSITTAGLGPSSSRSAGLSARPPWDQPGAGTLSHINLGPRHQCRTYQPAKLLSCSKTFSLKFCLVWTSIIPFWQKVACEKLPCPNFVCDTQIQIPRLLGASFMKLFLLHMIILVQLRSLFVYYATICTILT